MHFPRERRRLLATAILAIGVPAGAAAFVGARTHALADHLSAAAGVPARIGGVDADLTGTIRLSDVALGELVSADGIEASVALESLLAGELGADELRVASPHIALDIDRDGDSELGRVVRRLAHRGDGPARGGGGGSASRLRRIVVTSGALAARVAGLGELSAEGVELVPDAGGVRVITGPVHVHGGAGRFAGDVVFERAAAELALPRARFGRVLAVAGNGALAIDGQRAFALRDVAIGRLAATGALVVRGAVDDAGARRSVSLEVSPADLAITLRGERVPLAALAPLSPRGLDLSDARATGELVVRRAGGVEVHVDGSVEDLRLDHPMLAPGPIALTGAASGTIAVTPDAIALSDAHVAIGAARWSAAGWLRRGSPASGQLDLALAPAPCSDLLASMPLELRGPLDGMAMTGTFGAHARGAIDLAAPAGSGVTLDLDLANSCDVTAEPPAADVTLLAAAKRGDGWLDLSHVPSHVAEAFIAAEDARFFDHHGFDVKQIARSLEIDLRDHKLARGGSTISQQLVKNVYLTQRRSLDRKIQEAVLTWRLESRVDKKTILERYLNIIELGPKVTGVAAAAHYWFDESPHDLTLRQAAFLAALTAEPQTMSRRVRHAGGLDADSAARVDIVLRAMRSDGFIERDAFDRARDAGMHFAASALAKQD